MEHYVVFVLFRYDEEKWNAICRFFGDKTIDDGKAVDAICCLCFYFLCFSPYFYFSRHSRKCLCFWTHVFDGGNVVFNVQYLMCMSPNLLCCRLPIFRIYYMRTLTIYINVRSLHDSQCPCLFIFIYNNIQMNIFVKYKSFRFFPLVFNALCTWCVRFFSSPVRLYFSSWFSSVYFHSILHQQKSVIPKRVYYGWA